jgi:hypothetical protein
VVSNYNDRSGTITPPFLKELENKEKRNPLVLALDLGVSGSH